MLYYIVLEYSMYSIWIVLTIRRDGVWLAGSDSQAELKVTRLCTGSLRGSVRSARSLFCLQRATGLQTCVFFAPFGCFGHQRPSSRNSRRSKRAVITAMIPRVRCCASRLFGHSPLAFMKAILLTRCAPILHPRKKILVLHLSYTCPNTCPVLVL